MLISFRMKVDSCLVGKLDQTSFHRVWNNLKIRWFSNLCTELYELLNIWFNFITSHEDVVTPSCFFFNCGGLCPLSFKHTIWQQSIDIFIKPSLIWVTNEDNLSGFVDDCTTWYTFEPEILDCFGFRIFNVVMFEGCQLLRFNKCDLLGFFSINS